MKPYQYIISLIFALAMLSLSACSNDDDDLLQTEGENVSITFRPTLGGELSTRAIGDATGIDHLTVAVYEGSQSLAKKFSVSEDWNTAKTNGIELTLIEGRSYKILFWAENSRNSAYEITDDGRITVNYDDYIEGDFAKMEEMDAFFGTSSITVGSQKVEDNGTITLSRPLAQLNFADNTTQPETGTHRTEVTFHGIATAFNPFTGEVEMSDMDKTFVFTDFPTETMSVDESTYYYLSSNYLFAPQTGTVDISATIDLQNTDGTSIKTIELSEITLEKNKKTNVTGSIVQQPETWSVWDGEAKSQPDTDEQNRYIIDDAADIAWLCDNGATLSENSTFLQTKDIDMNSKDIASIQLPAGSTYDGGDKTIKNYKNSLFGNATSLSVQNLTVDNVSASSTTHVGVLVNTLNGSANFLKVTVTNSSATTKNGVAGGMVGNIKNNGTENLEVTFTGCTANDNTVSGSLASGVYVGRFRGYNNDEKLTFSADCNDSSATFGANAKAAYYTTANAASWFTQEQMTAFGKYSGWLGSEEYYRGTIKYGDERYMPCWDGKTDVAPLTTDDGKTKLIYSAFDLASLQGKPAENIKLMENVDMEQDLDGASKDGVRNHIFQALSTLTKLEGNGKTIYNITIRDNYYGGFVKSESCATTFENVTFDGADIRVTHHTETGNAYVGTLRGFAYAATTINNVHVKNGYLYGVNKMGGLCGGIFAELDCDNSSVYNYVLENQEILIKDPIFSISSYEIGFYPHGEIGGLIGYISANANINTCNVTETKFKCVGVKDMEWFGNGKIPGRHINQFIGDIRTTSGQIININSCSVKNNSYQTQTFTNNESESKGTNFSWYYTLKDRASSSKWNVMSSCTYKKNTVSPEVELVGCCYYIFCEIYALFGKMYKIMEDTKGELWVDGNKKF